VNVIGASEKMRKYIAQMGQHIWWTKTNFSLIIFVFCQKSKNAIEIVFNTGELLDKADYLEWSRKYDKSFGWEAQREHELGAKFRKVKVLTCAQLAQVVEWKFNANPEKKTRALELVARNDEAMVARVSGQVFSLPQSGDSYRMNCLTALEGISPVLASVILAFFDPHQYGIFDISVWKPLLGNPPPNLYITQNYIRLLAALRKTAAKHNLDARTIDKALYKKSIDASS